jgi:1,4-alpha-glucan branching enzyme
MIDWTENGQQSGVWQIAESVVEVGAAPFLWTDDSWVPPSAHDMIIYETHLGDFSASGDFAGLQARLPYLASLGVNAIEIMPWYEFPGAVSWGYNPAYYFAPEATYGSPADLKSLVDAAHSFGIAVLIDMVFNHLDASASLYRLYGDDYDASPWFHDLGNPWGFPDIDHWSDGTKQLTRDVVEFWMDEYHADGFRYDATAFIGWDGVGDDTGNGIGYFTYVAWDHNNAVYQVLEHLPQETAVVTGTKATSCWHDTFHDQMKANLREGQFEGSSFGNMDVTAQAIHYAGDGFEDASQVVNYTESHDEQRIIWEAQTNPTVDYDLAVQKSKLGAVLLMTVAGTPMLYHGQEFGEDSERTIDPNPLHWEYLESDVGAMLYQWYQRLIWLRCTYPSIRSDSLVTTHQDNSNHTISYWRWDEMGQDSIVVVANFDRAAKTFGVDFPVTGIWHEFLGDSAVSVTALSRTLTVPGSAARIYCRRKRWPTQDVTPPASPEGIDVTPVGDSLHLTWAAVLSDTLGSSEQIAYYDVYRDTVPFFNAEGESFLGATNDTTYVDGMPPDGSVFYQVLAWDQAGNRGIPSATAGRIEFHLGDESTDARNQYSEETEKNGQ